MSDLISKDAALNVVDDVRDCMSVNGYWALMERLKKLPSAQPLTDKEQRIFLAAMEREMKVCEEVDRNYTREPYEDSLVRVCREIKRKVRGALWT